MKMGHGVKRLIAGIAMTVQFLTGWMSHAVEDESQLPNGGAETVPTESTDVWYATLRNRIEAASSNAHYGGLRSDLRVGVCRIDFVPIPGLREIADVSPLYIPEERIILQGINEFSEAQFWREIEAHPGNVVFYVHGYNTGFEKGCRQAAIFQRTLHQRHRLILFSWPADGDFLKYTRDEADVMWSVPRMAESLQQIVRRVGGGKVDVVAHSLGARGVVMALTRIACNHLSGPFLKELVLLAPDIDSDSFRDDWPNVRRLAEKTTLYVSENDRALKISHEIHGYPRLGEAGEFLTVLPGIETIDVSLTANRRPSGHLYHLYADEVVADLATLLETGQAAAGRANLQRADLAGVPYWRLAPQVQLPDEE